MNSPACGVSEGVHRAEALLERRRAERRRDHHLRARDDVVPVGARGGKKFLDER